MNLDFLIRWAILTLSAISSLVRKNTSSQLCRPFSSTLKLFWERNIFKEKCFCFKYIYNQQLWLSKTCLDYKRNILSQLKNTTKVWMNENHKGIGINVNWSKKMLFVLKKFFPVAYHLFKIPQRIGTI